VKALGTVPAVLVDLHRVAALFVVALAVTAVPGPTVLFVVSRGVALGRPATLATVTDARRDRMTAPE
jgi:hypothetical protein